MPPGKHALFTPTSARHLRAIKGKGGQPKQRTFRTTYIRSAPKPRAVRRRVAATSACTSGFESPYLTLTTSPSASSQLNFGVVPPTFSIMNRHEISSLDEIVFGPGGVFPKAAFASGAAGSR